MKNKDLILDYITRAGYRLEAVTLLHERKSYADTVRESQELIELCLKALLRSANIEPPRSHDVSEVLLHHASKLPKIVQAHVKQLAKISKSARRDRELAFYGSEDLTPSQFYKEEDSMEALDNARWVYSLCKSIIQTPVPLDSTR